MYYNYTDGSYKIIEATTRVDPWRFGGEAFWVVIAAILLVLIVGIWVDICAEKRIQKDAINHGYGYYDFNDDGGVEFFWEENKRGKGK